MAKEGDFNCLRVVTVATNSATACSASIVKAGACDSTTLLAAGSVIQRGILRSSPSGPCTVTGPSGRRETCTTSNSRPASG